MDYFSNKGRIYNGVEEVKQEKTLIKKGKTSICPALRPVLHRRWTLLKVTTPIWQGVSGVAHKSRTMWSTEIRTGEERYYTCWKHERAELKPLLSDQMKELSARGCRRDLQPSKGASARISTFVCEALTVIYIWIQQRPVWGTCKLLLCPEFRFPLMLFHNLCG